MMRSRRGAIVAGAVAAVCAAILTADQITAFNRTKAADKVIRDLQKQVQSDASLAPKLAAEQKRITGSRLSRKSRDSLVAWLLIGAAAAFLICAADISPRVLKRPTRLVPAPRPEKPVKLPPSQ
jgi:hypothetical protein